MIFGILEYGEVRLFDDLDEVLREWGPYSDDVASETIVFYDADGIWLKPIIGAGPRRWAGMRRGKKTFTLERSNLLEPSVDPTGLALLEATSLLPNRHFRTLEELRARFPHGALS